MPSNLMAIYRQYWVGTYNACTLPDLDQNLLVKGIAALIERGKLSADRILEIEKS